MLGSGVAQCHCMASVPRPLGGLRIRGISQSPVTCQCDWVVTRTKEKLDLSGVRL